MNLEANLERPVDAPLRHSARAPKLLLHCGADAVPLEQVASVATPTATATWQPISHATLVATVQATLAAGGLRIGTQAHSLTRDGMRYFGLMQIQSREAESEDYCWVLGLRNSHDKMFPAGLVAGASVFVCDNLSFSGEIKFARKHTRFITRDLPQLVSRAVGGLLEKWHHQDRRIAAYREAAIDDCAAHDLIVRATDLGVCPNRAVPAVLTEWRRPRHTEFERRSIWSLFNAFTEVLKGASLLEVPHRTEALHGLLDVHVGLAELHGRN